MTTFIKRCRENAHLTQEQLAEKMDVSVTSVQNWESGKNKASLDKCHKLAEIFNIPVETLIKEMIAEEDKNRPNRWPHFLFDDNTNEIIDTLHLNQAQQDLFGLLYIYDSEYLKKDTTGDNSLVQDYKRIPYEFIKDTGSIRFINLAEYLHKVLRYVKPAFLMKVLRLSPESEFDVRKLSKDLICEFIDNGYKEPDFYCDFDYKEDDMDDDDVLQFNINMRSARIILPILEKTGPVKITDKMYTPIREDIPEELLSGILELYNFESSPWYESDSNKPMTEQELKKEERLNFLSKKVNSCGLIDGLRMVIKYEPIPGKEKAEYWEWSVNEKGKELLEWLKEPD